ncbi:MAG: MarR family transcriptional regulator [Actinobacteria bacterium]|nr:MarR family transcriptional regulator [Actinomycetota bacterium]
MSRESTLFRILDLIRRNQVLTQMLDEASARFLGVNTTDGRAIDLIDQAGRITAGDLARELRLSTGAVTTIVDRLEKAGYAKRVPDPHDRRRVLIEVTPKVHRLSAEIYGAAEDIVDMAAEYTDKEVDVLLRFQEQTRTWLEEHLAHAEELNTRKPGKRRLQGRGRA